MAPLRATTPIAILVTLLVLAPLVTAPTPWPASHSLKRFQQPTANAKPATAARKTARPGDSVAVGFPLRVGLHNFSEREIWRLWATKVNVSDAYLAQYEQPGIVHEHMLATNLTLRLGALWASAKRLFRKEVMTFDELLHGDHDYARVPCVLDFIKWTRKHGLERPGSMLTTDPCDPEMAYIAPRRQTYYRYDGVSGEGDLHTLDAERLQGEPFDFALVSQTLEHLYNPLRVLHNLWSKLRPGGYLFLSVPALNIQHMSPYHYHHFTPMGLAIDMVQAGFEVVEAGQWGNLDYESLLLTEQHWPGYTRLVEVARSRGAASGGDAGQPFPRITNDRRHPCQVWTLVRRPL